MEKFKVSVPKSRNGRIVSAVGGVIGLCVIFACMSSVLSPNTDDNMRQIGAPLKKQGVGATFAPKPEYPHVQRLECVF